MTDLVTPRKTRAFVTSRSDFVTSRQSKNFSVGHLAHGEKKFAACARWPSPWHYFWDIFGSPGQEGPSWAKWVSPLNSSMKTTTFKPNLYFYHRIPLSTYVPMYILVCPCTNVPMCPCMYLCDLCTHVLMCPCTYLPMYLGAHVLMYPCIYVWWNWSVQSSTLLVPVLVYLLK